MSSTINIYLDSSYGPRVVTQQEIQDSLDKGTGPADNGINEDTVIGSLNEVLNHIISVSEDKSVRDALEAANANSHDTRHAKNNSAAEHSNVITVTGNRGTGKSSILRSLQNYIGDDGKIIKSKQKKDNDNNGAFSQTSDDLFFVLDVVDPSTFRSNDAVFETVVAKMFHIAQSTFEERAKSQSQDNNSTSLLNKLFHAFEKLKKAMSEIGRAHV